MTTFFYFFLPFNFFHWIHQIQCCWLFRLIGLIGLVLNGAIKSIQLNPWIGLGGIVGTGGGMGLIGLILTHLISGLVGFYKHSRRATGTTDQTILTISEQLWILKMDKCATTIMIIIIYYIILSCFLNYFNPLTLLPFLNHLLPLLIPPQPTFYK